MPRVFSGKNLGKVLIGGVMFGGDSWRGGFMGWGMGLGWGTPGRSSDSRGFSGECMENAAMESKIQGSIFTGSWRRFWIALMVFLFCGTNLCF